MVKTPVVIKEDYIIYFEYVQGIIFAHCDFFNWNKTSRDNFLHDWNTIKSIHGQPIMAMRQHTQGNKFLKFLKLSGFRYYESVIDLEGNQVDFYITNEDK
jgi:hypothetical protein